MQRLMLLLFAGIAIFSNGAFAETTYYFLNFHLVNSLDQTVESHVKLGIEDSTDETYQFCEVPVSKSKMLPVLTKYNCGILDLDTMKAQIVDERGAIIGSGTMGQIGEGIGATYQGRFKGGFSFNGHEIYTNQDQTEGTYYKTITHDTGLEVKLYGTFKAISKEAFDVILSKQQGLD